MNNAFYAVTAMTVIAYYLILRLKIFKLENRIEELEIFITALKDCLINNKEEENHERNRSDNQG